MIEALTKPAEVMADLPPAAFGLSSIAPRDLPQVAEAYDAGARIRESYENTNRWTRVGHLVAAQEFYAQDVLLIRRPQVTADWPTTAWPHAYPNETLRPDRGAIAATAAVLIDNPRDQELWQDSGDIGQSFHVHRLATHPNYYGQRQGEALLASVACGYLGRSRVENRPFLRLDCAAEAIKLRRYYTERIGMACVGETTRESNGYHAALFEAEIAQLIPRSWRAQSTRGVAA